MDVGFGDGRLSPSPVRGPGDLPPGNGGNLTINSVDFGAF